ncbi:MAG: BREX system ATP-binding domain-containing protein [Acidobacteriota bacterium]
MDGPSSEEIRVRHAQYGAGTLLAWRRGGRYVVVRFDSLPFPIELPAREILMSAPAPEPPAVAAPPPGPAASDVAAEPAVLPTPAVGRRDAEPTAAVSAPQDEPLLGRHEQRGAALTIEAMRLGVVPAAELSAYTVGRDQELAIVARDIADSSTAGGAVRAFIGDYGAGKTHLLELIQQRLLDRGYMAAMVMLDPEETSPSHPKRVYRALVRALRYPDRPFEEGEGLRPLLEKAARSPEALAQFHVADRHPKASVADIEATLQEGFHLYISPAVSYMRTLGNIDRMMSRRRSPRAVDESRLAECIDLLEDWIEGHPTISNQVIDAQLTRLAGRHPRIYSLLDYRPWARIYGYLLSGISALARAVGYSGLTILLDEAEFYSLLSRENRAFADHLFKSWTYAAIGGDDAGTGEALPFDAAEIEVGGYGIQQRLPGRHGNSPGLYVVFAMTPSPDGLAALGGAIPADRLTNLTPLDHSHYMALAAKLCDFYASAYSGWALPGRLVEPLGKVLSGLIQTGYVSNPRHAMKFLIEFLDVVRYHPSKVAGVVRDMQYQVG